MTSPEPDWVEQARRFVVSSGLAEALGSGRPDGAGPTGEHPADHAAECRWCPVCAGLAAVRGRRPDLVEGLADLLGTAATVLRTHAGAPAGDAPDRTGPPPADRAEPAPPAPAPVQRIDVA
ncbi:hypothetical protein [Modestobacter lapidis]|nr:hypothetical protein [Modestobacter lapidis]